MGHSVEEGLSSEENVEDLISLMDLSDVGIERAVKLRYGLKRIYTWAGPTLVAVNPFTRGVDNVNPSEWVENIQSPHVFAVAEKAWRRMLAGTGGDNQTIVVSGESGAGKTVSSALILKYFSEKAAVAELTSLLHADAILEVFGNARTQHNDNSSRFGKLLTLHFRGSECAITSAGAIMSTYLLEKTRASGRPDRNEQNYHVFYQMLFGLDEELRAAFGLKNRPWAILGDVLDLPEEVKMDRVEGWKRTTNALKSVGVSEEEIKQLCAILAGILHLGNVDYDAPGTFSGEVSNGATSRATRITPASEESLLLAAKCLGIPVNDLGDAFSKQVIIAGARLPGTARRSVVVRDIESKEQIAARRDTLIRLLYEAIFSWLCAKVNGSLPGVTDGEKSLGILDVYGFESLDKGNNLEQLCINYANERLQGCFIQRVLRTWKDELTREFADEDYVSLDAVVDGVDNIHVIRAIDDHVSLFGLMNEQCRLRTVVCSETADEGYLRRLTESVDELGGLVMVPSSTSSMRASKTLRTWHANRQSGVKKAFCVLHYAGPVEYTVDGMVAKNRDQVPGEFASLLKNSEKRFLVELKPHLLPEFVDDVPSSTQRTKRKLTILSKFKNSLDGLMNVLRDSEVHFVRCIKPIRGTPSGSMTMPSWDSGAVQNQLRALGIAATIEVARAGLPNRCHFPSFIERYFIIIGSEQLRTGLAILHANPATEDSSVKCPDIRSTISDFLLRIAPSWKAGKDYRIGVSRIFMSDNFVDMLEKRSRRRQRQAAIVLQLWWRAILKMREEEERLRIANETLDRIELEAELSASSDGGKENETPKTVLEGIRSTLSGWVSRLASGASRMLTHRVDEEFLSGAPASPIRNAEAAIMLQRAGNQTPTGRTLVERNVFRSPGVLSVRTSNAANARIHLRDPLLPGADVVPLNRRARGLVDLNETATSS